MLLRSLANYYYWTLEPDKAKRCIEKAIEIAEKDKDVIFTKGSKFILETIKKKPDPFELPETKPIDEMTVEEYQEMTKKLLEAQGIKVNNETDHLAEAISIGLRDINPKPYFEHCENLHVGYVNTSPVGMSIGLPSMGTKFVWCKHCKGSIAGFDLKGTFELFKQENCCNCKFHKPRSKDWICKVKWIKEQENQSDFKKVLDNFRNNW